MTNEVRKPREFWVAEDGNNFICQPTKPEKEVFETLEVIHCKEILPGDDSIRVSRETIAMILETLDHAKQVPNTSQADISFLTRRHAAIIERIERENPPKQDEGK